MAKQSGLGDCLLVDGYNLSGDITALNRVSGSYALQDVTTIKQYAVERITSHRDGSFEATTFYNPGTDGEQEVLSKRIGSVDVYTDVHVMYLRGVGQGVPAACLVAKQINYDGTRNTDGSQSFVVQAQANRYGLEWCDQLTEVNSERTLESVTSPGNGASYDTGAQTTHGLQAYLQVVAFTGTDLTIRVQHSPDDSVWTDLITFTQLTSTSAHTTERVATLSNATVNRYLRVRYSTTGGFTTVTPAVAVNKNSAEVIW